MRHVSDHERRARLAVRHALAPAFRAGSPESATRAMTVLHATAPATVYLSCWARTDSLALTDVDRSRGATVARVIGRQGILVGHGPGEAVTEHGPAASAVDAGARTGTSPTLPVSSCDRQKDETDAFRYPL